MSRVFKDAEKFTSMDTFDSWLRECVRLVWVGSVDYSCGYTTIKYTLSGKNASDNTVVFTGRWSSRATTLTEAQIPLDGIINFLHYVGDNSMIISEMNFNLSITGILYEVADGR